MAAELEVRAVEGRPGSLSVRPATGLAEAGPDGVLAAPDLHVVAAPPSWYERRGKRLFDLSVAAVLLLLLAPVLLVVALAVRVKLGPGVLFRQERVGLGGSTFTVLKFRTMQPDRRSPSIPSYTGAERRRTHKDANDPRHTPLGRLLRRTSLDELPQLINVLRGDMSLVGPRPEIASVARDMELIDHPRHRVRPGVTGMWQVSPLRARASIRDGLRYDLVYVSNVTFRQDLAILVRTAGAVVRMAGS